MKSAGKNALIYLCLGIIWILVSDRLVYYWFDDDSKEMLSQSYKGLFYVLISAILVYFLIKNANEILLKEKTALAANRELLQIIADNTKYELILVDAHSHNILIRNHVLFALRHKHKEHFSDFLKNFNFDHHQVADARDFITVCVDKMQDLERDFITDDDRHFTITFIPLQSGNAADRVLLMMKDCTDAKTKEKESQRYRELLNLVLESKEIGLTERIPPNHILSMNTNLRKIIGLNENENLSQKDWLARLHHDDRKKVEEGYRQMFSGDTETFEAEYRIKTSDDSYTWLVEYARVAERNDAGEPKKIIGVLIDFDHVKNHEATIKAQARLLREFAFSNSHKVRAPLARILGLTKLITAENYSGESHGDPEFQFILSKIDESAEELDKVLQDFALQLNSEYPINDTASYQ